MVALATVEMRPALAYRHGTDATRSLGSAANDTDAAPARDLWAMGTRQTFARNREIYAEGNSADRVFKVVSGAVRTFQLLEDGRRQVNAFYLQGEIFGLEASESYRFSAEAIVATQLVVVKRDVLRRHLLIQPELMGDLWRMTASELERAQRHFALLGRKNAVERVASFLIAMSERTHAGDDVELPMSRQDIADFLGLTIETVSRTMTLLEEQRLIELPSARHVVIRNRRPLEALDG
ncbi:helix-turn-helix domain-containing protein [Zavarzinia sp. CC-PAN008]|uniref:helix-turn-helix domain-containing protein n=1 Tax=Zavarzinia sp. CC-PAN008 TaxID=3243332 RepID=UPI003F747F51